MDYCSDFLACIKDPLEKYIQKTLQLDAKFDVYFSMNFDSSWIFLYGFAPAYFSIVKQSVQDSLILHLINLIEDKERSDHNLNKFIDKLKIRMTEYDYEAPECCRNFIAYLDEQKVKLLTNLKTWRDKLLVHLDNKYFYDSSKLSMDAPLSFDGLRDIISNLLRHLCGIYSYFFHVTYTTIYNKSDYKNLFLLEQPYKESIIKYVSQHESDQ